MFGAKLQYTKNMKKYFRRLIVLFLIFLTSCSLVNTGGISHSNPTPTPPQAVNGIQDVLPPAPSAQIHFGRIDINAGLSQSSVMAIVQDNQGFMWFGTEDGLNRYDGAKFKIFRPMEGDKSSISDVWIRALTLDADGSVWAGTRQGGANRYDARTEKFTRYQHDDSVTESISDNNVRVIFSDAQDRLWFGTNAGLDLFDPQSGGFEHFLPPDTKDFMVQSIVQNAQGDLWIGTLYGLWRFDPKQKTFSSYKIGEESLPIFGVLINSDGTLWLATIGSGLIHYDPQAKSYKAYLSKDGISNENIRSLWRDPSGKIWAGTIYGLNLFDPATDKFINYFNDPNIATSLSTNFIHTLYQDNSGILWIGTYGGSLDTYDPLANKFTHYYNQPKDLQSLGGNMIFSIAPAPDGTVWIGTTDNGLDRYDPRADIFTHYRHDPDNPDSLRNEYIASLCLARDGMVWVGTDSGLDRLDPSTGKFTHYPSDENDPTVLPGRTISAIYQDETGTIWIGTVNGVVRYDESAQTFTRYAESGDAASLNSGLVNGILKDSKDILWAGSFSGGLSRVDLKTGAFKNYRYDLKTPGSISNDSVLAIHESQSGDIWVATGGGGLNRYDPASDSFTVYNDTEGLPNNVIYGILEDEAGNLWLSTNLGIARFDPRTGTSRNYTTADGLQSNEFNVGAFAKSADGRMYFGGINGLNVFDPSELRDSSFITPLRLVSVTLNGIPLKTGIAPELLQDISLKYPDNSFEFESAALSFSQSNKNQYAYKLEGFDSDWYYAGTNRTGRYSNLPGGEYTLRVKAANADNLWNEDGIAVKVTVIPPFWQTWWFYSMTALILLAGVFGSHRYRLHSIEKQKQELEWQVNERAKEIERLFEKTKDLAILEERNRLARDLHDSAKQKAFAALAELGAARSLTNGSKEKSAKHLQEAETLVGEVIQEITFLIQEIHPATLKEKGLASTLREYVFEWSNRTGIHVDLKIEGDQRLSLEIEQALYRSIQEALANVARHSAASAVSLVLIIQSAGVNVSVSDDGHGFELNHTPNGMGLHSIRERVESIGGTFNIESVVGQGTRLALRIPIKESL
jgi:signal transduction histidine kinase/ligand-binding sensor domain-containing protein